MHAYHYRECGLSNVYIFGLEVMVDDEGDDVIQINAINHLHAEIARGIVNHAKGISGEELRFLRSELGLTQAELAVLVHRDKQTIGRWERGETEIESTAETVIRQHAIEVLGLEHAGGIERLAQSSVPTAEPQPICIDMDGNDYRLRAA